MGLEILENKPRKAPFQQASVKDPREEASEGVQQAFVKDPNGNMVEFIGPATAS